MFKYDSKIKISKVGLKVKNIKKVKEFYSKLGFFILEEDDNTVKLGLENKNILLELEKTNGDVNRDSFGLYHFAILLPNRQELANFLGNIYKNNLKMIGASDHGYSNAIYFEDPEGNGIEVYCDTDYSTWDIKENGDIIGFTKALNLKELLESANLSETYKFSNDTIIGHLHFSYSDDNIAGKFLDEILSLNLKTDMQGAKFFADGKYHHHIAVNSWNKYFLKECNENSTGISFYELQLTEDKFLQIENNLISKKFNFEKVKNSIKFKDFNGVNIILSK